MVAHNQRAGSCLAAQAHHLTGANHHSMNPSNTPTSLEVDIAFARAAVPYGTRTELLVHAAHYSFAESVVDVR